MRRIGWKGGFLLLITLMVGGVALACGDDEDDDGEPDTLRLAVTDLQGLEELQREFGEFAETLEDTMGTDVEFFAVNDRTAAAAALDADQVDLVFTGPAEYVVIRERTNAEPVVAIRRPGYRSCIYVRADSGIATLEELRGKRIAMSDVGSTSGHLGPSQLLVDAGIDPLDEMEVLTVGDTVHEALKRGDVDAVGIGCHDYEEFMQNDDPEDYPVLIEGDPLPPDVIVAREGLSDDLIARIQDTFTENWEELLDAMLVGEDNQKYQNAELVVPEDSDYDVVRSMYRAIGVDDFTEFVGN